MTTRLEIATHIYARLIVRDLHHATAKPQDVAHRALLFADALLLSDQQSAPLQAVDYQQACPQKKIVRTPPPTLEDRITERRNNRPTLH